MTDFQNQKERIKEFINSIGMTNSSFEKSLNLSNGYINSMRKGLGYEKLEQISIVYPELNMGWLLTGEGNMLNGANNATIIGNYWWQWLFTSLFLAITTICINIVGDTLRDVMDPKSNIDK